MKTKNQAEHNLLAMAVAKAANEDAMTPTRETNAVRKQAWSPLEVWRTRVKASAQTTRSDPAQI
jgi:hypothetical protein